MKVRTRYAPSPTGYMHIGNLKSALVEYLIAKRAGGDFVLRIEDTDQKRQVDGALDAIYKTLKTAGLRHDEGPDIGGPFAPYTQSERRNIYLKHAEILIEKGAAYYCFCPKERLDGLRKEGAGDVDAAWYDRRCLRLSKAEIDANLSSGMPYVVRQLIPEGKTTFHDEVFGDITFDNAELDDQILIKSDGLPTYNFANVVDDHLMEISHVVRGVEYITSTPKYNLLYSAFGWEPPKYVHVGLLLNESGAKMSKRRGDASFEELVERGFLPEAVVNYVALLGWSPPDREREIYSLAELAEVFDIEGMSKAPSTFDLKKLTWLNGEYFKKMEPSEYFRMAEPYLKEAVKSAVDLAKVAEMTRTRVSFVKECAELADFIDAVPAYEPELYEHKKMKTNPDAARDILPKVTKFVANLDKWDNAALYESLCAFAAEEGLKNSQPLWCIRVALSGKAVTPCGATEIMELLGKDETIKRLNAAIGKLGQG